MDTIQNAPGVKKDTGLHTKAKNCAECRRLKLKCSRTIPCNHCEKAGKAALCPDRCLLPKAERFAKLDEDQTSAKMGAMAARIRELEDALADMQRLHSDEPHSLLSNTEEPLITSFGALMIGKDGNTRFFGGTSTAEFGLTALVEGEPIDASAEPEQGTDGLEMQTHLPLYLDIRTSNPESLKQKVLAGLPSKDLAIRLVEIFYARVAWQSEPIIRSRLINQYLIPCYENPADPSIGIQGVALLFATFALAMLNYPEAENCSSKAEQFNNLSKACLSLDDFILNTSVTTVAILILQANYNYMVNDATRNSKGWVMLGVAARLAQVIGLHRDPEIFGLPPDQVADRRKIAWELVSMELWTAMVTGRPPMMSRQHFDVKIPRGLDTLDPDPNYTTGKHYFSEACLWHVVDLGLASANKATYAAVLRVDARIREFNVPKEMMLPEFKPTEEYATRTRIRQSTEEVFRELTLLCLHRSYFACALLERPFTPLKSPYTPSFLASYGSACAIVGCVRRLYAQEPVIIMRMSLFWTYCFTATVILAAIVIRAPDCSLAGPALTELDLTVEMFRQAQAAYRPRRAYPIVSKLHAKAHDAMKAFNSGTWQSPTATDAQLVRGLGGSNMVINHLRDATHATKRSPSQTLGQSYVPADPPFLVPSQDHQHFDPTATIHGAMQHPQFSLEDYLRSFHSNASADMLGPNLNNALASTVSSSDDFLRGILSGECVSSAVPSAANLAPPYGEFSSFNGTTFGDGNRNPGQQSMEGGEMHVPYPGAPPAAPSPLSDGGSSTRSAPGSAMPGYVPGIPPQLASVANPVQDPMNIVPDSYSAEQQAAFLWDNILRELDIPAQGP